MFLFLYFYKPPNPRKLGHWKLLLVIISAIDKCGKIRKFEKKSNTCSNNYAGDSGIFQRDQV